MRIVLGLLGILLASPAGVPAKAERLRGFTPERSGWQRAYEARLAALPQPSECDALLRELTREPHVAGTPGNERVARFIADEFRKAGLEVTTPTYDVLLSYPKSVRLEIVGEPGVDLARSEEPVPSDPDTAVARNLPPWNAYSPSADLTAEVVYVNRGSAEDYDELARMGVPVRGRIALARYFGGYRGGKALEGEKRGVAGILVYSDPIDDGWYRGEVYPPGPWGNASHFQRGAAVYDFLVPGDPLTPGWASTAGARRIAESESVILPKIPMMPLSARDAAEILKRLKGPSVPEGWQGLAVADTYRVGPGVRVHLVIENTRERRKITNVIGVLRGSEEPERKILLSNHHDAWVYGAVDPSSGTATMISLARALGTLARQGLRPRRTIVFGDWDGEEYTLTGSTEWGEENEADLARNAIVCINVDASTSGRSFSASASPLAFEAIRALAADVADPGAPGKTVAETWREGAGRTNVRSDATGAPPAEDLPIAILGSGSDYTVFFNRLGIPSVDLVFDGPYGVYHSVYDDYAWMATAGDPGFLYHAAMARYAGSLALRFANADVFPFDASAYGREIARYAEELAGDRTAAPLSESLGALARQARDWSDASAAAQKAIEDRVASGNASAAEKAAANRWLLSLERSLLDPEGLPGRPWFRHLVYAPLPSYAAETLPAVREAAIAGDLEAARRGLTNLSNRLATAAASARAASGAGPSAIGASSVFLGTITDAECGADHGPMIRRGGMGSNASECTLACAAKGVPFGFVDARSRQFFQLDDAEKARPLAGKAARVTGRIEGDTIRVESIDAAGDAPREARMDEDRWRDFGRRYAAAWSGRDPARLASLYSPNGSLTVNGGAPSVGREAITRTASGFMTAFPDMVVTMEKLEREGDRFLFRWIWTGTNSGPGGTGKAVRIRGFEEWTMGSDGLIARSLGHFDEAEYRRQLQTGVAGGL
jgi:N-acetylated-alpha-linked acidic dipeptidase